MGKDAKERALKTLGVAHRITRDGKKIAEVCGYTSVIDSTELDQYDWYDRRDLFPYAKSFLEQLPRLVDEYNQDKFSRRLIVQFPVDGSFNGGRTLPCLESFMVLFSDENSYEIMVNWRSSDVERINTDIALVLHCCRVMMTFFDCKAEPSLMHIMVGSMHSYLEGYKYEPMDNRL